jgi:hypothetical protein
MIQINTIEERTQKLPGEAPVTVVRTVRIVNNKGRKTVRVIKGRRVIASDSEAINLSDTKKIHRRKMVRGLFKKIDRRTRRRARRFL